MKKCNCTVEQKLQAMTGKELLEMVDLFNKDKEKTQKFIDDASVATQGYEVNVAADALLHLAFHVLEEMCE